jgi:uncharacterized protein DUF6893
VSVVGHAFVALLALTLLGALVVVARSFPDIRRYLRMRRM